MFFIFRYLLCPCGNIIKVYSTNTGECFQRLVGHNKLVTGISHHPKVKLQVENVVQCSWRKLKFLENFGFHLKKTFCFLVIVLIQYLQKKVISLVKIF